MKVRRGIHLRMILFAYFILFYWMNQLMAKSYNKSSENCGCGLCTFQIVRVVGVCKYEVALIDLTMMIYDSYDFHR